MLHTVAPAAARTASGPNSPCFSARCKLAPVLHFCWPLLRVGLHMAFVFISTLKRCLKLQLTVIIIKANDNISKQEERTVRVPEWDGSGCSHWVFRFRSDRQVLRRDRCVRSMRRHHRCALAGRGTGGHVSSAAGRAGPLCSGATALPSTVPTSPKSVLLLHQSNRI